MIRVEHLNKSYERARAGDRRVLKDVSFSLPDTGFVCILGPSGCGKTSLLNAVGGLDRFDNGTITAGDTTVSRYGTGAYEDKRNRNFGYIFQNYYLLDDHTVAYNIYLGLHSLELSHREKIARIRSALKAVEMERYIHRRVRDLSGGQQQRVAIARALARRPRVIFADEPTGNLDEANTMNICTLLRKASRDSLVIMVTHEERIANFFADRIIRLDQGMLVSDSESWERQSLEMGSDKEIYAGDLQDTTAQCGDVKLRLLRTEDAPPVELTVIAAKDRVILKISDERAVTLSSMDEKPRIVEGKRPVMTLETVDRSTNSSLEIFDQPPDVQCRAGKGLGFSLMARESTHLLRGKGLKQVGMRVFLVLLAVLTLLTCADYYTISKVDPQDFIISDSHMLVIKIEQGSQYTPAPDLYYDTYLNQLSREYVSHIAQAPTDFDFIPMFSIQAQYDFAWFTQMKNVKQKVPGFSYVDIHRLRSDQLICGRMPQSSEEIVVDKILIDAILERGGILNNMVEDYSTFLGESFDYGSKRYNPVIVGISDSGERGVYASQSSLYALSVGGISAITVSELRERYPNLYDVIDVYNPITEATRTFYLKDLQDDECVINAAQAGEIWTYYLERPYGYTPNQKTVKAYFEEESLSAKMVVTDAALEQMITNGYHQEIHIWCADKAAMRAYLSEKTQAEQDGQIVVKISDPYAEKYALYEAAATMRADARTIVTFSIVALSMVMLYLLCRSRVNERLGMVAVYRLLGIPGRKLYGIFLLESGIAAFTTLVPTVVLTWAGIALAAKIPELNSMLELPLPLAAAAGAAIVCYYLLVSVLPLGRLLRCSPASLAAKYDL